MERFPFGTDEAAELNEFPSKLAPTLQAHAVTNENRNGKLITWGVLQSPAAQIRYIYFGSLPSAFSARITSTKLDFPRHISFTRFQASSECGFRYGTNASAPKDSHEDMF